MDERYELNGITFIWDASKARMNLSKHQVSFEQAAEVFFDPFFRVIDASPTTEARDAIIGMDGRCVEPVVCGAYCHRRRQHSHHLGSKRNAQREADI